MKKATEAPLCNERSKEEKKKKIKKKKQREGEVTTIRFTNQVKSCMRTDANDTWNNTRKEGRAAYPRKNTSETGNGSKREEKR